MKDLEAKRHMCPILTMAALVFDNHADAHLCSGPGCMMWRWHHGPGKKRDEDDPEQGFCGLAGVE